jgi:hypothetical protein
MEHITIKDASVSQTLPFQDTMSSVLVEVVSCEQNIRLPDEVIEESQLESWVATPCGGFAREGKTVHNIFRCPTIKKRLPKKAVQYFVDHCQNTQCSLVPKHAGLCSHQVVYGKRSRKGAHHSR